MVFDFLKKKLQEMGSARPAAPPVATLDYEGRRGEAEELYASGRTDEAVALLDGLAEELAGAGSFPLAVAVRHQIHAWRSEPASTEAAVEDGRKMAQIHATTGPIRRPARLAEVPPALRDAPLFAGMNAEEIAGLIQSTGRRSYTAGDVLIEEGQQGNHLSLVTRGILKVETKGADGRAVMVGTLTVGDVFGEVAVLTGRPRTATVTADSEAECLEISQEAWTGILGRHPRVQKMLEELMKTRAQLTADAVVDDFRKRRSKKGS